MASSKSSSHQARLDHLSEERDTFEIALEKSGCSKFHYTLQDCYFEHKDWRKCQKEMAEFKKCTEEHNRKKKQRAAAGSGNK